MLTNSRWDYHWADHLVDSVAAYKEATWLSSERYDNDNDDNDDNDNDDNVPPGVTSQRQCQWFVICRNGSQMIFGLKRLLHIFLKKPVLFGRNRRDFTMIFKLVKLFHTGVSLYAGWRVECQTEIDSTWTFPDSVEIDRATRSNLRQSARWQYWYFITILQSFNFMTFDLAWFSASSKEREELKVRLVSGVERQTNTFEVKMMLTVLLMMIMMERQ